MDLVLSRDEARADGLVAAKAVEEVFVREGLVWELRVGGQIPDGGLHRDPEPRLNRAAVVVGTSDGWPERASRDATTVRTGRPPLQDAREAMSFPAFDMSCVTVCHDGRHGTGVFTQVSPHTVERLACARRSLFCFTKPYRSKKFDGQSLPARPRQPDRRCVTPQTLLNGGPLRIALMPSSACRG